MDKDIAKATFDSIPKFSFKGQAGRMVKVVNVVDGDTVDIVTHNEGELVKLRCRLDGIDCAEMKKGPGMFDMNDRRGWASRDFLIHICKGKSAKSFVDPEPTMKHLSKVKIKRMLGREHRRMTYAILGDFDKYGRVLVKLKLTKNSKKSFNQLLKDYGYEKKVDKKRKRG